MTGPIDTLLLLALPAAGKSEIRRYLDWLDATGREELGIGPPVQIDDFPYVHLMRRISAELAAMGRAPVFFPAPDLPFADSGDWDTLIELINEDHRALTAPPPTPRPEPGRWILDRLDGARRRAGLPPPFTELAPADRGRLAAAVAPDAAPVLEGYLTRRLVPGSTVVVEFARGGPAGAAFPLPHGYASALARLSPAIRDRAGVLYVRVDPEESRRKNAARARPGEAGSILYHGVPPAVMEADYGCDDLLWLVGESPEPGTITVDGDRMPVTVFDNRADLTSFLRDDPAEWSAEKTAVLHRALADALAPLRPSA